MPGGMNGRQLALQLRERWPDLRVLYTSGYAHGRLTIDGESVPTKYVLGEALSPLGPRRQAARRAGRGPRSKTARGA